MESGIKQLKAPFVRRATEQSI